jgi:hypothetical protein
MPDWMNVPVKINASGKAIVAVPEDAHIPG